jgi:plasmid stabilization system protein ParE
MKGFILTSKAKQDLSEVWDYIADDDNASCRPRA